MQAPKGAQEVLQAGPNPFDGVVVDLVDAITIRVPRKFVRAVLDRQVLPGRLLNSLICGVTISVQDEVFRWGGGEERGQGLGCRVRDYHQA